MNENTFEVVTADGIKTTCHILFTFENEETGKNYIVYTDDSKDANGNTQIYASIFNPEDPDTALEPIESEEEWKAIETILETLREED